MSRSALPGYLQKRNATDNAVFEGRDVLTRYAVTFCIPIGQTEWTDTRKADDVYNRKIKKKDAATRGKLFKTCQSCQRQRFKKGPIIREASVFPAASLGELSRKPVTRKRLITYKTLSQTHASIHELRSTSAIVRNEHPSLRFDTGRRMLHGLRWVPFSQGSLFASGVVRNARGHLRVI